MNEALASKKIKVLVLTTTFPIDVIVGKHIFEKCAHLVNNQVDVTVVAPSHPSVPNNECIDGIHVKRFDYFFPKSLQRLAYGSGLLNNLKGSFLARLQLPLLMICFFLKALIHAEKADIIHCHWLPAGLVGVLIKIIHGKKIVLMMHHPHEKNFLYRLIVQYADWVIANSTYVMGKTLQIYNNKNNRVIPVAIDSRLYHPTEKHTTDIRQKLNISPEGLLIFSAGRFISWKGYHYLIKAMDIIVNQKGMPGFKLILAGDGYLKEHYLTLIEKFQLQQQITLVPFLDSADLVKYYNAADIFVIPSIVDENGETEGLGLVAIEAGACETPVVGSAVGGIVDVIENGKNGFLCHEKDPADLAEKILTLAQDPELRIEMGKQGRAIACEKFDWDAVAVEIIKIYHKISSVG